MNCNINVWEGNSPKQIVLFSTQNDVTWLKVLETIHPIYGLYYEYLKRLSDSHLFQVLLRQIYLIYVVPHPGSTAIVKGTTKTPIKNNRFPFIPKGKPSNTPVGSKKSNLPAPPPQPHKNNGPKYPSTSPRQPGPEVPVVCMNFSYRYLFSM